jgi:hypothetical protein
MSCGVVRIVRRRVDIVDVEMSRFGGYLNNG